VYHNIPIIFVREIAYVSFNIVEFIQFALLLSKHLMLAYVICFVFNTFNVENIKQFSRSFLNVPQLEYACGHYVQNESTILRL